MGRDTQHASWYRTNRQINEEALMRYRRVKRDANHKAIVDVLRVAGATVIDLSMIGNGCPDLLVGFRDANYLLEIKNPAHAKVGGDAMQSTKDKQLTFRTGWRGREAIVTNTVEALCAIGAIRRMEN